MSKKKNNTLMIVGVAALGYYLYKHSNSHNISGTFDSQNEIVRNSLLERLSYLERIPGIPESTNVQKDWPRTSKLPIADLYGVVHRKESAKGIYYLNGKRLLNIYRDFSLGLKVRKDLIKRIAYTLGIDESDFQQKYPSSYKAPLKQLYDNAYQNETAEDIYYMNGKYIKYSDRNPSFLESLLGS